MVINPSENSNQPSEVSQRSLETQPMPDLRVITPQEIVEHFDENWEKTSITEGLVPEGWHGALTPEGERRSGHIVLLPQLIELAGTQVRTPDFVDFLRKEGFSLQHYGEPVKADEAVRALDSTEEPRGELPVFRALRPVGQGKPPMEIDIYSGVDCPPAQTITEIGNMEEGKKTDNDRKEYIEAFNGLLDPFIGHGTTRSRIHMGLGDQKVRQWRIFDDCGAGKTSVYGVNEDKFEENNGFQNVFLVDGAGISTLQAITGNIWWANNRGNRALGHLVSCGTISKGLGGPKEGTMYMINTTPLLLKKGKQTSGDIGDNTDTEECKKQKPHVLYLGNGSENYLEFSLLRGGWFILNRRKARYEERNKPQHGKILVCSASRIDNSPLLPKGSLPTQWGVVINYPQ